MRVSLKFSLRSWFRVRRYVQGVDDTGQPTQDGQTNVDQEISTTSALQEDTQRRQDDGEDNLANVTVKLKLVMFLDLES